MPIPTFRASSQSRQHELFRKHLLSSLCVPGIVLDSCLTQMDQRQPLPQEHGELTQSFLYFFKLMLVTFFLEGEELGG